MENFRIEIASVPDRDNLVAEIWYEEEQICEISNEEKLEIEFYIKDNVKYDYFSFVEILNIAKNRLIPDPQRRRGM